MKLKKIASLMLAGIMAVSMLTACGGNTVNNGDDNQTPDVTVTHLHRHRYGRYQRADPDPLQEYQANSKLIRWSPMLPNRLRSRASM